MESGGGNVSVGDLVWAHMRGHPAWPGKVMEEPLDPCIIKPKNTSKDARCVYFFCTGNHAWLAPSKLKPYSSAKVKAKGHKGVRAAIRALQEYRRRKETDPSLDDRTLLMTRQKKVEDTRALMEAQQSSRPKIGFLGLGMMGLDIANNLLKSGHEVMVWHPNQEVREVFLEAGSEVKLTPSEVVQAADVTFNCLKDPDAAKEVVVGPYGILQEVTGAKGYIELAGLAPDTSLMIAEAIRGNEGKYLKVMIHGSQSQAEKGILVILASGDEPLFQACQTCFQAIGKHCQYFPELETATKMHLLLQHFAAVVLAGLAENVALADLLGLKHEDSGHISLACSAALENMGVKTEGEVSTQLTMQNMQRDLMRAWSIGHQKNVPMVMSEGAHQTLKRGMNLGYSEFDPSAVYVPI